MLTFTQLLAELTEAWPGTPRHLLVLATRFYLGADTKADLERMARPMPCTRNFDLDPVLTDREVEMIVTSR